MVAEAVAKPFISKLVDGLASLYTGADKVLGGLLPNIGSAGVDLGAGYLGKLYSGADKLAGGYLPNLGITGTVTPAGQVTGAAAANSVYAPGFDKASTQAAFDALPGPGGSVAKAAGDLSGTILPAGSAIPPGYVGSSMGNSGNILLTPQAAAPSGLRAGLSNFMSYAKPAVGLASAIGGLAAMLDGKGKVSVPTGARSGGGSSRGSGGRSSGGSSGSRRAMEAPKTELKREIPKSLGSALTPGTKTEDGSEIAAVTPGETNGELGAKQAVQTLEATAGMPSADMIESTVSGDLDNLLANVTETKSTLIEQQEMAEEDATQDAIQQFVAPTPTPSVIMPMNYDLMETV